MPDLLGHTTHARITARPGAWRRAACSFAVAGLLAAGPAAAQTQPAEGAPPADGRSAETLKRMEDNQAARIRDLLTMITLGASKQVAISVGSIESTADGAAVRVKNMVIVDRQSMMVQVLPLVVLEDLDRRHTISRHFRMVMYSDVVIGSLPPMAQPMIQAMGLDSLAGRTALEFKFDEASGTLEISNVSIELNGVARIAFNLQLVNVPPLNDMILLAAQERIQQRLAEVRLKSATLVLYNRRLNSVVGTIAGMFGGGGGGANGNALVAQLEQLKAQAQNDLQRRLIDAMIPAAKGPAIVTVGLSSPQGVPLIALERVRDPLQLEQLFTLKIEGRTVTADEALPARLPAEARETAIDTSTTDAPAHACDTMAAVPDDPAKKAEGVPNDKLNTHQAIADCYRATIEYPATARFHMQLGRSLVSAGLTPMANAALKKAADMGSETAKKMLASPGAR